MISNWADQLTAVAVATLTQSNQSIPSSSTGTKLPLDTEHIDKSGTLEIDTSNNQIVIKRDGIYCIVGHINWVGDSGWSTGDFAAANLSVNGNSILSGAQVKAGTGDQGAQTVGIDTLSTGDTISVNPFQDSGASKDVKAGNAKSRLIVARIGDQ